MTTEQFIAVYKDRRIKRFVWAEARRMTKLLEIQEEYVQEAWLALSQAPADKTVEWYQEIITRVIQSARDQEYRHGILPVRVALETVQLAVDAGLVTLNRN